MSPSLTPVSPSFDWLSVKQGKGCFLREIVEVDGDGVRLLLIDLVSWNAVL